MAIAVVQNELLGAMGREDSDGFDMSVCAIVLAAGVGKRMGTDVHKQFLELGGRPLLAWTLMAFEQADSVDAVVLVAAEDQIDGCREQFVDQFAKVSDVVQGGAERQDSVALGLDAVNA